jgi:hypothetical protein
MKRRNVDIKKAIKKRIENNLNNRVFIEKKRGDFKTNVNMNHAERDRLRTQPKIMSSPPIDMQSLNKADRDALRQGTFFRTKEYLTILKEIDNTVSKVDMDIDRVYDICVVITTFNRESYLKNLLSDIDKNKGKYNVLVMIFDDGSENIIDLTGFDVKYVKYINNHGKKFYWRLITDTMNFCKNINSKYYIYLPDDVTLVDGFFEKSIELYEKIDDKQKICLSLLMPKQQIDRSNWTNVKPIKYDKNIYKTQWCDMCFISEKKFFEKLNYSIDEIPQTRWMNIKNNQDRLFLSSGVGENVSKRLHHMGYGLYHIKKSLVLHDDHDSVMNEKIRQIQKLTT